MKIKKTNIWKIATFILGLIVVVLLVYTIINKSNVENGSTTDQPPQPDQPTVLADTSGDPEVEFIVISDKDCKTCDTTQVIQITQTQLFPNSKLKELDYSEKEAKDLIEKLEMEALPAYIFDSKVTETANYANVQQAMAEKDGYYYLLPEAVGAGKYLKPISIEGGYVMGEDDAPIVVVEFSEFLCPYCAAVAGMHDQLVNNFKSQDPAWEPAVTKIKEEYVKTGKVKLVFKDFVVHGASAQKASEAGACADEQGKFWEMHDLMFKNQNKLSIVDLKGYAEDLGLDIAKFDDCLDTGKMADRVKQNSADARKYGVTGTPAFFVNGEMISGAQPFSAFKKVIDAELAKLG